MMTLLMAGPSPYVRKVRVTLIETGLADQTETQKVAASPLEPDPTLTAMNPVGKVPTLLREDGPALYDSRVICRYLDARAGAGLYPESRLWEVLTLEATADGILDAAVGMIYEARFRPEEKRHAPWLEGQWAKIARSLDALEDRWTSHLAGRVTMAQIAIGCALGYLDFRHPERDWRAGRPQLAAWFEKASETEAMQATKPE
ncbi:putative glutathione S-transferase family protein [Roseivivax marinus]|uniref:Putative glutathione S-transferase family protein n=2 Tax=Roseivivax marinus TaxID=1379903 RepID=W4HGN3_9RHOB|nr:putative glutathione S-transferase family protein [Roseivivax marinus]SEL86947.1 Glutathione S-transferase [Roseivivax marinus]